MDTVKKKMTPGFWGVTALYHSLGIRIPRELGLGIHKFGLCTSFTAWCQELGTQIPRTRWENGLDHASIFHFDDLSCDVFVACIIVFNMCDRNV